MGKWNTYRRRGTPSRPKRLLGPPNAPTMYEDGGYLYSQSNQEGNLGGLLTLYYRPGLVGEWEPQTYQSKVQDPPEWLEIAPATPGYYTSSESGNGIEALGESELAEPYLIE